jgi:hypothetical protein
VIQDIFPLLLHTQLEHLTHPPQGDGSSSVAMDVYGKAIASWALEVSSEALANLMMDVQQDIPLAVNQIFHFVQNSHKHKNNSKFMIHHHQSTNDVTRQTRETISKAAWLAMWYVRDIFRYLYHLYYLYRQAHPELFQMMTIDGMKKMMEWASMVQPLPPPAAVPPYGSSSQA